MKKIKCALIGPGNIGKRAAARYEISARDILVELGRRGMVGGQEDMIEDTALTLAKARGVSLARAA